MQYHYVRTLLLHYYLLYSTDNYDILCLGVGAMPHGMVKGQQIMLHDYNLSLNVTLLTVEC